MTDSRAASGVQIASAEHPAVDGSASEHIFIGSEEAAPHPSIAAQTVREKLELRNAIRRTRTAFTLYDEGFLQVLEYRNNKRGEPYRLDLRYLDPVPSITHVLATRALYITLGCGAVAAIALLLVQFGVLRAVTLPAGIVAGGGMLGALWVAIYRSHETIRFSTIHGRATVLCLIANLGSIRRTRALIPALSRAIEEAADTIGADTSGYLRAEMREHYRLRGDGVLTSESCAESTGRILAQFEVNL
jgi:hypothetical protein